MMRYVISLVAALSMLFVFSGSPNIATAVSDFACTPEWSHLGDDFPEICGSGGIIVKESAWEITWPDGYVVVGTNRGFGGCFQGRQCWPFFNEPTGPRPAIGNR